MGKEQVITYKYIADLFAVDRKEAVRIYKKLEQVVYKSNDVIIRAGDEADGLYFLEDLGFGDLLEQVILKVVGDNLFLIPALLFVLFLVVTIGLGTCWGTLGLAIPITVFLAVNLGISVPLCMGATLSASIVGETLCPYIDDSLPVITSIGCEPDAYRKIRVQYWTPMAVLCLVGYLILGLIFI